MLFCPSLPLILSQCHHLRYWAPQKHIKLGPQPRPIIYSIAPLYGKPALFSLTITTTAISCCHIVFGFAFVGWNDPLCNLPLHSARCPIMVADIGQNSCHGCSRPQAELMGSRDLMTGLQVAGGRADPQIAWWATDGTAENSTTHKQTLLSVLFIVSMSSGGWAANWPLTPRAFFSYIKLWGLVSATAPSCDS